MSTGSVGMNILTGGAGQAAGALVGPAADASKGIYKCLKRKYYYIKYLGRNFENLEKEARYLSSREKDVNNEISRNQVMREKTHECETWLEDVSKMTDDLKDLKIRYQKANNGSCGPCLLHTRLKLSREIVKMTTSVVDLKDRMKLDDILLRDLPVERIEKKFPKKIDVPTQSENVERLLEFLKDDSIKKVGIWGMPGVGKTTILENLHDEVGKLKIFDIVVWVTVSKEGGPRQIQREILKRLGVKGEGVDAENPGASLISRSLANKKYLLLLDEVSSIINLRDVGIYESDMQGKVVIATRERIICNMMETDEEIKVERLSKNDARKLFRDVVGVAFEYPGIRPIAEKVLKQCGELPQLIRAVGIHLKGKFSEDLWSNTLSRLQSPSMDQLKHMQEVFTAFKLIYDDLQDSLKDCLLYGASFPEDYEIYKDYLVECWKAEQLIGIGQTLKKACAEGHSNLDTLMDRCLFDRCKTTKYVKMPIIFRNAALKMAYVRKFEILVIDGEELESHPPLEKWKNARVVSLMNSDLVDLPENPECLTVSTLFLQKNESLSTIPASFFNRMPTLKILDLFGTGIKFLPSSISELTNLTGLYLNDCHQLEDLPVDMKKLQNLEVLDIRRTRVHGFPEVIEQLTCLRCLRVSFTSYLSNQNHAACNGEDKYPSKILQLPIQLEDLTIDADPKDPRWNEIAPEIAVQLAGLKKLSSLSFYFPTAEALEAFTRTSISWKNGNGINFRSFNIYVGSHGTHNSPQFSASICSGRRYFHYSEGTDIPNVIKEVLLVTHAFQLIDHQNITSFSDFGIDEMVSLEVCEVKECNAMTTVVSSCVAETRAFPWLKELHLLKLQQLTEICQGPISSDSFANLTTLTVYDCPNLLKIVSGEMGKQLKELQYLRVEKCSQAVEVIEMDPQCTGTDIFPKLKILELVSLERLVNIHTCDSFEWHALRQVNIVECEKLVNLRLNKMNATKLHCITCNQAWWGSLMLNDDVRTHLQAFCCFI